MASFWKKLLGGFMADEENKGAVADDTPPKLELFQRAELSSFERYLQQHHTYKNYPVTFQEDPEDRSVKVFEPSLKHYTYAYRRSDPRFDDDTERFFWHEARGQVIEHLLGLIMRSSWSDQLVLRGSLLLRAWLGEKARDPGDIDWVYRRFEVGPYDKPAVRLFDELSKMASTQPWAGDAVIQSEGIAIDDIWTYERAAGRRIVFPWQVEGLPGGVVQMDVVFNEHLCCDPQLLALPVNSGASIDLWAVSKEVSLASKLLWLQTDCYPQGKDLYDATLLAEKTYLPRALLKRVLQSGDWNSQQELNADFPLAWTVDWENFIIEYPWIAGTAEDWQKRLSRALRPTFAEAQS